MLNECDPIKPCLQNQVASSGFKKLLWVLCKITGPNKWNAETTREGTAVSVVKGNGGLHHGGTRWARERADWGWILGGELDVRVVILGDWGHFLW